MPKPNYQKLIWEELKEIKDLLKPIEVFESKQDLIKLEMKNYTAEYLFEECKKLFPCSAYLDLSKITSERKGTYTVYFKNVQEADEENKNLSADDLKERGIKGITLEERLLLEIEYFKKMGNHLDINNWTLCSGSRDADGRVPRAGWSGGGFSVDWCSSDFRHGYIRARSAVFLS